jgi:hypothetical protein
MHSDAWSSAVHTDRPVKRCKLPDPGGLPSTRPIAFPFVSSRPKPRAGRRRSRARMHREAQMVHASTISSQFGGESERLVCIFVAVARHPITTHKLPRSVSLLACVCAAVCFVPLAHVSRASTSASRMENLSPPAAVHMHICNSIQAAGVVCVRVGGSSRAISAKTAINTTTDLAISIFAIPYLTSALIHNL